MSGSYDRPGGRPPYPAVPGGFEPYDDMVTGPATGPATGHAPRYPNPQPHGSAPGLSHVPSPGHGPGYGQLDPGDARGGPGPRQPVRPAAGQPGPAPALPGQSRDLYVPARATKSDPDKAHAPIVPAGSVTGRSLTLVISIMCFLACLTAGAVYMMHQSADAWMKDIASEVTIQIEPKSNTDTEKTIKDVLAMLKAQTGIKSARALSAEDSASLLEPWLGSSDALKALPVPRLIALEMDVAQPPDLEALRTNLSKQFKGVNIDDHRQWQRQIRTVTRSFALGGLAILLLVCAATTAIIVSATRSAMASNREIVEVLHFVGATDRFIAREFEKHFLRLGVRAGIVGAGSAMAVFFLMPMVMEILGGGGGAMAEMHRLIGTGALDPSGYVLLGLVVVVIAALCMITSRLGVYRILNSKA